MEDERRRTAWLLRTHPEASMDAPQELKSQVLKWLPGVEPP